MKTTITFNVLILALLMSFSAHSQTHVYNESTTSGIFIDGGEVVSNPNSDAVNSSANVAKSGTGWQKIEFFPNSNYTPVTGDKIYFSVYNPNSLSSAQLKFDYSTGETEQWGGNVSYETASTSGWVEHSLDLTDHVGKEINKIWLYLAGGESNFAYVDNVYFHTESVISSPSTGTTHVYNEDVSSGIFIDGGEVVNNPNSDAVNSSANVAKSGTGWQKIEFFPNPNYTPVTGDKIYFSVYNPNSLSSAQLKFDYSTGETEQWGGNVSYEAASTSGWVEHSLDLTDHVGKEVNKIWLYLAGGESNFAYVDNVYFSNASTLNTRSIEALEGFVFFDSEGRINFEKNQTDAELEVYDLTGRLLIKEKVVGKTSNKSVRDRGVYILKVVKEDRVSTKKLFFK